ncbi:hypothetical protein PUMCH_004733 [Australozyma saopauloensis]|uniref:Protein phosphatase n=1 Tax=Australozyma saopauloensis TaxID=291208 RepID=A0AAX4HFS8_9ASCO|nr:hypothetical protein PUMCH_004733 [[Candida] saopauloensis]
MAHRRFYIALFLIAMFVSIITKRVVLARYGYPTMAAVSGTRSFIFSSRAQKQTADSKAELGWSSPSDADPVLPGTSAASLTAYNYDQASFEKLILYNVAVAFQPKNRTETNVFKKKSKKSPAELLPLGEDNLFVSAQDLHGYMAVGVADGVGGWSEAGYDSLAILRELCHQIKSRFEQSSAKASDTPKQLLQAAFADVTASPKVEIGGTTACLGILTPEKQLKVANLGDSWCGLFRDYKLVKETQFQTHNFNTPYQLAKIPAHILRQAELQGKRYIIDKPDMCDEYVWDLKKDDVIIFATDGVTDNVVPQDIELFLKDQLSNGKKSLSAVSSQFVKEVVKVSKDANFPSAFAQELSRITGQRYMGGKEDDITVVMVKVL